MWHVVSCRCHHLLWLFRSVSVKLPQLNQFFICTDGGRRVSSDCPHGVGLWIASCFTFVTTPPTLLPFIKGFGIESFSDFVHFVTKAGYEGELTTCLAASAELAEDRIAVARLRAAWVAGERAFGVANPW